MSSCAILFSGGTDSMAAAAICAEKFDQIHLLTFHEKATETSPLPVENVNRLRARFPLVEFRHIAISTDDIVRELSYGRYWRDLLEFGFSKISIASTKRCLPKSKIPFRFILN